VTIPYSIYLSYRSLSHVIPYNLGVTFIILKQGLFPWLGAALQGQGCSSLIAFYYLILTAAYIIIGESNKEFS